MREFLLVATGVAVPFYEFPIARIFGKPVDPATVCAGLFVLASLPLLAGGLRPGPAVFFGACVFLPLLVLLPPRPGLFAPRAFAISYAHWTLVTGFFFCALCLPFSEKGRKRLLEANIVAGTAIALFALYQVLGVPRGWPATGTTLVPFQREPFRFGDTPGYLRPTSIFPEPAWMGGYLVWVLVLGAGLLAALRKGSRALLLAACAFLLAAMAASVSWGVYADLFASGIVLAVIAVRRRFVSGRLIAVAAGVLALLIAAGSLSSTGRRIAGALRVRWSLLTTTPLGADEPSTEQEDTARVRFQNALCMARLIGKHPLRGVGLGQFANYARAEGKVQERIFGEAWCGSDAWVGWPAITAELGFLGPLLLLAALLLVLRRGAAAARTAVGLPALTVPALVAFAAVAQIHTASYIDLWWWYPLSVAAVLGSDAAPRPNAAPRSASFFLSSKT